VIPLLTGEMSVSSRRPSAAASLSTKEGADALHARQDARQNSGPSSSTARDLRSLGIDVDSAVIERLQALGLHKAWAVASQAAISLKERHAQSGSDTPDRLEDKCTSPIKYQNRMITKEESAQKTPLDVPPESECMAVDRVRVACIHANLNNRESPIPPHTRGEVLRLLKLFKAGYGRAPDLFIQQMMGRRSKKEPLEAKQLVMKTRYVDLRAFSEIMTRLSSKVTNDQISCMFNVIGEKKTFGGQEGVFILDLWVFLALLKHAEEETRRSFDYKTSRISSDVEFWNNQNKNENVGPANDNRRRRSPKKERPQTANDINQCSNKKRSAKSGVGSVAEAFGSPVRVDAAREAQGKFVHGCFSMERAALGTSVSDSLHAPYRPKGSPKKGTRRPYDSAVFGDDYIPLGRYKIQDDFRSSTIGVLMTEGVGVSKAIYGRSLSPGKADRDRGRAARGGGRSTSMGSLLRNEVARATTVAEALGSSRLDAHRPGSGCGVFAFGEYAVDARKKVSTLGKPPYCL
jgi:hypothetical protein